MKRSRWSFICVLFLLIALSLASPQTGARGQESIATV